MSEVKLGITGEDVIHLVRGDAFPIGLSPSEATSDIGVVKEYDAECAAGFYLLDDDYLAAIYAVNKVIEAEREGIRKEPYLHYYDVDFKQILEDVRTSFFIDFDERHARYIADNTSGKFPDSCSVPERERIEVSPVDLCHRCKDDECERSAPFIAALLSDYIITCLNKPLASFALGNIDADELESLINDTLEKNNLPPCTQSVFRASMEDYLHHIEDKRVGEEVERRCRDAISIVMEGMRE